MTADNDYEATVLYNVAMAQIEDAKAKLQAAGRRAGAANNTNAESHISHLTDSLEQWQDCDQHADVCDALGLDPEDPTSKN